MAEVKKRIPKRRFKEFQNAEAWEELKLSELAEISTGYPFDSEEFNDKGNCLVITNGNIQTDLDIVDGSFGNRINIEINDPRSDYILEKNDILVTMDGTVGRTAKVAESNQILAQRVGRLVAKSDPSFLYQFLNNGKFFDDMKLVSHGGTIKHISLTEIGSYENFIPNNLDEEIRIGKFLNSIDDLITLHQRKLNKIKSIKKAYLSEMFPAKGESRPKRRFMGFTDDWELVKVGKIGSVQTCKRIFKEQTSVNGDIPFYKNGTLGLPADSYISKDVFDKFKKLYPFPEVGDILMTVVGSIGRTVEYMGEDEYFQDSNIVWLKTNKSKINSKFLKISYNIIDWVIEGSTIKHLYNDNILLSKIWLPSISEQEKIGHFFKNLDNLITLHQQKLDKLKNLKKSYLNEMFV